MTKLLSPILNLFRFHKLKIAALFFSYVFFLYWMFPFNDLGDLVSAKVSQLSQGEIFVDFDNLALSLIPQPGLSLSNVSVETPFAPTVTVKSLEVAPSISGLLSFKPGVTIRASDLFGGDVVLTTRGGDKTPAGKPRQKVSLEFSNINLSTLSKLADLPLKLEGNLSGDFDSLMDPELGEQPQGHFNIHADRVIIPEGTLTTQFGPVPLPRINISDALFEGQAEKGTLDVTKLVIGKPGGDIYASLVGKWDIKILRTIQGMNPIPGGYDLSVHLTIGDAIRQKLGLLGPMLGMLSAYQNGGNSYAFKLSGPGPDAPPNLTKIQ